MSAAFLGPKHLWTATLSAVGKFVRTKAAPYSGAVIPAQLRGFAGALYRSATPTVRTVFGNNTSSECHTEKIADRKKRC